NLISFITMYLDKKLSINKKRRISEKTLFSLSLILGAFGIYTGMYTFRHKTKHKKFIILIPIIFILNILTVYYIINYLI
ncbi:MAG: DUF1294 domain-containing protein, partial [Clostridia bacterium]